VGATGSRTTGDQLNETNPRKPKDQPGEGGGAQVRELEALSKVPTSTPDTRLLRNRPGTAGHSLLILPVKPTR